jgi:hypothetical protein
MIGGGSLSLKANERGRIGNEQDQKALRREYELG